MDSAAANFDEEEPNPPTLESLTRNLSRHTRSSSIISASRDEPQCCCGDEEKCVFSLQTKRMLADMEGQVQIAGTLGQALLRRHESTMEEAQKREQDLLASINDLEHKTSRLENTNAEIMTENRMLRQNLEDLEADMKLAEARARDMQEELDETHAELSRVAARAARADILEAQLSVLESEQEELRNTIITTREEERAATARWRKSERALQDLGEQLERITHEHALEKARSRNILERMEQQRTPLKTSSGSSAASAPSAYEKTPMSRFMKEILAENGHLQMGIAELRELLAASQEEVNQLREKLENNVAVSPSVAVPNSGRHPLSVELERTPSGSVQTVVHHHHYHPPPAPEISLASRPPARRSKRRKNYSGSDFSGPPSANRISGLGITNSPPNTFSKRWSHMSKASTATTASTVPSSFPTSPSSTCHESSIFDRFDTEDSRPTSAGSEFDRDAKPWQRYSAHTRTSSTNSIPRHSRNTSYASHAPPFAILHTTAETDEDTSASEAHDGPASPPRTLRRTVSHESMLSIVEPPYMPSPSLSAASSATHRLTRPGLPTIPTSNSDGPQAAITPGVAIRDASRGWNDSAYSRLLGLQQDCSPPKRSGIAKNTPGGVSGAGGWFWRWGASVAESTKLPGIPGVGTLGALGRTGTGNPTRQGSGSESGASTKKKLRRAATEPRKGLVDVDGLREALNDI